MSLFRATAPKSAFFEGFSDPTSDFSKLFQSLVTKGGKKELVSVMMETGSQSNRAKNREFDAVALEFIVLLALFAPFAYVA